MRLPYLGIGLCALAAGILFGPALQGMQGQNPAFIRVPPEEVKWVTDADGIGRATIAGDPTKPGIYVIRVKFPAGKMSTPHMHHEDRYVTVLQGTWWSGTGAEFAPDKTTPMKVGSFMKHPGGANHFDGAKNEDVIVQIIGIGPSDTIRVRPQDGNYRSSLGK